MSLSPSPDPETEQPETITEPPSAELPTTTLHCLQCGRESKVTRQYGKMGMRTCLTRTCRTIAYELRGDLKGVIAQDVEYLQRLAVFSGDLQKQSPLFEALCAVLDVNRVPMADGTFSDRWCRACEERVHAGPNACDCPCHDAWKLRRKVEKM